MTEQTPVARYSKTYREKRDAKAAALGVKRIKIEVALGVEQRLVSIIADHKFNGMVELFQTMALNLADAAPEVLEQMLKRPSASVFKVTPRQARQLREFADSAGKAETDE
jgi:hypothetical protein